MIVIGSSPITELRVYETVIDVQKLLKVVEDPILFQRINGWLTLVWFLAAFPICIFLSKSVPFLVFISVYAVVTGHLATWQAARVEARQEEDSTEEIVEQIRATQKRNDAE
jgi:hypothetical protein